MSNDIKFKKCQKHPKNPKISILIPTLNEEKTIEKFLNWCHIGIAKTKYKVEILIVDSSDDNTANIALNNNASVVKTKRKGLGQAYIDGIPFVKGDFVILGDADCTYDFREINKFIEQYEQGYEFVMGSRFKGTIEKKAMPFLHQYFGTPATTFLFNLIFSSQFSDIHCGMRGITRRALIKMKLQSKKWEYASEMILKSVHMKLKTTEIPINFFKDTNGRESHMIRSGWMEPWKAGWQNICSMLIYGSDFFFLKPGIFLFSMSFLMMILMYNGPLEIGSIQLSIFSFLVLMCSGLCGATLFFTGITCKIIFDYNRTLEDKYLSRISLNRFILIFISIGIFSIYQFLPMVKYFFSNGYNLNGINETIVFNSIFSIFLLALDIMFLGVVLILNAIQSTSNFRK